MKKLFLLLGLIPVFAHAQNVKLTWSPEIDNKKKVVISDIIHADKSGIYYTTVEKKGGMMGAYKSPTFKSVDKISSNFSPIYSKEFTAFSEDYAVEDIQYAKNHFLIFLSKNVKKTGQYYVSEMDMNGNVNGSPKEYFSTNEDMFAQAAYNTFSYSHDSTKFLVLSERGYARAPWGTFRDNNKKKDEASYLTVLNNDGAKLWQKEINFGSIEDGKTIIVQDIVSPDGNVFLLIKEYNNEKGKDKIKNEAGKKVAGYKYKIMAVTNNGATIKNYDINLGNQYINSADIKINTKSNNLICSGFYNDQDNEVLKGLFYFEIDQAGTIIKKSNKDFPSEFVEEFKSTHREEVKKDKKSDDDNDEGLSKGFSVDNVYVREDGGAYLIGEYYSVTTVTTYTSSGSRTNYYYHYEDILVVNITPDGKIDWFHRIPKRQLEMNRKLFSSYISLLYQDKLYILFNDNPKNAEKDDDEKSRFLRDFGSSDFALITLDKEEKSTKKILFNNYDLETIVRPMDSKILGGNVIILYAAKGKDRDVKLGKLVIE